MAKQQSPIAEQLAKESHRRARLAIPAVAGGVLYLLSAIMLNAALSGLPAVGIVQGLSPALSGRSALAASPRGAEVSFIDKAGIRRGYIDRQGRVVRVPTY